MKIGNKSHISFELTESDPSMKLSKLEFYLGEKLISDEQVYLPAYISSLQSLLDNINRDGFRDIKFEKLSSEQAYTTLLSQRDSDESQFFRHLFRLDETIDQYTIVIFQENGITRFVWTCWDEHNCNSEHELNKIYSVQFPTENLASTINALIEILNKQLANI